MVIAMDNQDYLHSLAPATEEELNLISQQLSRGRASADFAASLTLDGNLDRVLTAFSVDADQKFTSAIVIVNGAVFVGAAKRNTYARSVDPFNAKIARDIALTRAMRGQSVGRANPILYSTWNNGLDGSRNTGASPRAQREQGANAHALPHVPQGQGEVD